MGASTKILVGVEVKHSDFFIEKEEGFGCNRHPGEIGKYCSKCGSLNLPLFKDFATEHLKKFCKVLVISEEIALQDSCMVGLTIESGRGLYIGSSDWTGECDGPTTCYVLGVSLLETKSAENEIDKTASVSIQKFIEAMQQSSKLVADCGFNTDDVRIFQTKYLTY